MKGLRWLVHVAVAVIACLALAGAALADDGNGNGNGNDSSQATATTPGQDTTSTAPGNSANAPGRQNGTAPGNSANAPGQNKPANGTPSPNASPKAQHHVIICHRTGSKTNPWVVINVDIAAWPAHKAHGDVLLKDPAKPGEKMSASACPKSAPTTGAPTSGTAAASTSGAANGTTSAGGVAGATATRTSPSHVLGRTATTGTLPFTGIDLKAVAGLGLLFLVLGLALRRRYGES